MIVEVVKGEGLGKERVERHVDVRSVDLPSTRGMVRLDDVVDCLEEYDNVHRADIEHLREEIDDDPSTGGHIGIHSPSSSAHTAAFERVEIFADHVHDARGSSCVGPEETWMKTVISRDLDERIDDAVHHDPSVDVLNRSELVAEAVTEYLADTSVPELVAELQERGHDVRLRDRTDGVGGDE